MKISIIGTGYVGLVSGVCLAAKGHKVICVDKKTDIVTRINNKEATIYEPGLDPILKQVVSNGNLTAVDNLRYAVMCSDVSIIAVGTPFGNGKIDLSYIIGCANEIGQILRDKNSYHVVCVKSTVAPTTTDTVVKSILETASGKSIGQFGLAMNPEFLREGKAVEDFMSPDRIVIGAYDDRSFNVINKIYKSKFKAPIIRVNLRTAEMIKYTSNALLASLISYSNEIASICEETGGIDVKEVLESVTLDKRFNPKKGAKLVNPEMIKYLRAGCGFGGSCFPKDVKALISFSESKGYTPDLLHATIDINETQPLRLVRRLEASLGSLQDKKIAVLGLAFKPDTDDMRESPSLIIIKELLLKKAKVFAADPIAIENANKALASDASELSFCADYKQALQDADAAVLVTSWPEFASISRDEFVDLMKNPVILDGRRVYDKSIMEEAGINYIGVGLEDVREVMCNE
ncbi:MAG: UDP-glucose/GDP-mannose dehydrogenase family protein [Bacillota bacterium]|nr:UDP-glucose/GDP-mannose dehydrogenase family protein [Bacillota bacterium]